LIHGRKEALEDELNSSNFVVVSIKAHCIVLVIAWDQSNSNCMLTLEYIIGINIGG